MLDSLLNKAVGSKFLKTPILNNIYERLLLVAITEDCVEKHVYNISFE